MNLIGKIKRLVGGGSKEVVGYERGGKSLAFDRSAEASYGVPVPVVYGTFRIKGIIIQAGLYMVEVAPGLPGDMVQMALCEGEIVSVLNVWREQVKSTPGALGLTIATGTLPQPAWAWMTTNWPQFALGYGGVALASCDSGHGTVSTGELQRSTFEVRALLATKQDGATSAYDSTAFQILIDILENPKYGLGWSRDQMGDQESTLPFRLGADGTLASGYFYFGEANTFWISLALTEQRPARDIIDEVLTATDAVSFWSEGQLKIRPLGEESVTGNGVTYVPYVTPQYDLGASGAGNDFGGSGGDPRLTVERAKRADVYNCHPVEWTNRIPARVDVNGTPLTEPRAAYRSDMEDGSPDPIDVSIYGLRKADPVSLRCITRAAHAKAISDILTRRALYTSRVRYRFRLGWRFALLEPTDLVTLTDSALGISRRLVRIEEIEEQEDGSFDVVAAEVGTITTASAAAYTVT